MRTQNIVVSVVEGGTLLEVVGDTTNLETELVELIGMGTLDEGPYEPAGADFVPMWGEVVRVKCSDSGAVARMMPQLVGRFHSVIAA